MLQRPLQRFLNRLRAAVAPVPDISAELWLHTLARYPFLATLPLHDQAKLRALAALFLQHKEFTGAHGLHVTDAMAVSIAAQACLPLLHLGEPRRALAWYDDFVTIVVQPPMASPNSPTCGHPKFPRQDRLDYDDSVPMAMRAAASLSR